MPFHRLPDDLVSLIAKHALLMEVEEYGPSEDEWLWPISTPSTPFEPRVREVLEYVNCPMPPLVDATVADALADALADAMADDLAVADRMFVEYFLSTRMYWVSLQFSMQMAMQRAEAEVEANFGSSDFWAEEVD